MEHYIYEFVGSFTTTPEEEREISQLTEAILYNHLLNYGVGLLRPHGEEKYIRPYEIGNIKISIQLAYYLSELRDSLGRWKDNSCMDLSEFKCLLGAKEPDKPWENIVDVKVVCGNFVVIPATQMTLSRLIVELQHMILTENFYR